MNEEQLAALKNFIYWSCRNAVAEATDRNQGEYNRLSDAEKTLDEVMKFFR